MRLAALGSAALILLAPGFSAGQGFTPYFSRADFFEVAFPGQPTIQDIKYTSEYTGVFPARVYGVVNERGRFLVTVVDYTNAESIHKERLKNCPPDAQSECIGSEDAPGAGSWRYDLYLRAGSCDEGVPHARQQGDSLRMDCCRPCTGPTDSPHEPRRLAYSSSRFTCTRTASISWTPRCHRARRNLVSSSSRCSFSTRTASRSATSPSTWSDSRRRSGRDKSISAIRV